MRPEFKFIIIASIIGGGLLLIFLWFVFSRPTLPLIGTTPVPTVTPLPNVFYNESTARKVINLVQNRPTPSTDDAAAREALLTKTNHETGIIYQTATFNLMYLKSPDLFQAQILTTNITKAKEDAQTWLNSQGFSSQGICHLPLTFYLSQDVSRTLYQAHESFNPLPLGC